jgi:hypothetical protein
VGASPRAPAGRPANRTEEETVVPVIQVINAIRALHRDAEAAYRRGDVQDGRLLEAQAWQLEEELAFRRTRVSAPEAVK